MCTEWARNRGTRAGLSLLADYLPHTGECEQCGRVGVLRDMAGGFALCRECGVDSLRYWETRGACSSDIVFDEFPRDPGARTYRVAMSAYWATISAGWE